jgi:hypothetical protein
MTKHCPGQAPRRIYPICGRLPGAALFQFSFVIRFAKAYLILYSARNDRVVKGRLPLDGDDFQPAEKKELKIS